MIAMACSFVSAKNWLNRKDIDKVTSTQAFFVSLVRWPTRDMHAFSVEIYCCSVEIDLLHALAAVLRANLYRCSVQNRFLYTNIRSFSVQKLSLSVENSMLLCTNRMLLRGKFDISSYKSKASAWKIRCFSVQIESFPVQNSMLLRTNRKRSKASPWKTTQ